MNIKLKRVPVTDCLFFDSETASLNKFLKEGTREYGLFQWKNRDKETNEVLDGEELQKLYERKAPLTLGYNQVVTIGVGFVSPEGEVRVMSIVGTESDIIKKFCEIANTFKFLVSFNGISFDMPMIVANGNKTLDMATTLADKHNTSQKKEWNLDAHYDLLNVIRGTHYVNVSFDEACYMYDVPSPKTGVKGHEVSGVFHSGGIDSIRTYVKDDVFALIQLFQAMRHETVSTTFTDVDEQPKAVTKKTTTKKTSTKKEVKEEVAPEVSFLGKSNALVKLNETKLFSEELQAELREDLKKGKYKKSDREAVFTLLLAGYLEKGESELKRGVRQSREDKIAEINWFLDTL